MSTLKTCLHIASLLLYAPTADAFLGSQPMSTAVHRIPNKLWRSNSIFNLWSSATVPLVQHDVCAGSRWPEARAGLPWRHPCLQTDISLRREGTNSNEWSINVYLTNVQIQLLKVVCNENQGGSGRWHRSRIVAINVFLSYNFDVVFNFNVFPFPPSKAHFLGMVPMNTAKRGELFVER